MEMKIFLFHRVSPERDLLWDPIAPATFERMIRFISKNYQVVPFETSILQPDLKKKSKTQASIVFDDGYKDFAGYALPILKKYHCPCSMYVVTDCVTQQQPPWTYILDYHFIHSKKMKLNLSLELLPANFANTAFSDTQARLQFARQLKPFLKKVSNSTRIHLYHQVLESLDDVTVPSNLIMNWTELNEIKKEGVVIGSHTRTHPLLNKLETAEEMIDELKGSAEQIKKQLGHFPITISYPIGGYNEQIKKIAAEQGYQIGLAVNQVHYNPAVHDRFEIPRIELYNESMIKSRLRISGIVSMANKFLRS